MFFLARALLLLLALGDGDAADGGASAAPADTPTGTVCLDLPGPGGFTSKSTRESRESAARQRWRVQLDDRPPVRIKAALRVCVDGFALDEQHRVRLFRNGSVRLADRFRFTATKKVTIHYDSFYGNLRINP